MQYFRRYGIFGVIVFLALLLFRLQYFGVIINLVLWFGPSVLDPICNKVLHDLIHFYVVPCMLTFESLCLLHIHFIDIIVRIEYNPLNSRQSRQRQPYSRKYFIISFIFWLTVQFMQSLSGTFPFQGLSPLPSSYYL